MADETSPGTPTAVAENGHVSFSDLVRAHYEWDSTRDPKAMADVHRRFQELLQAFQHTSGEIVDAYWCRREASAVALTRREREPRGLLRHLFQSRPEHDYRLHRVSDWVTAETHEIADLLHDADILAIKAANSLEGVPREVVMQWLLEVESHLLGFIERHRETPPTALEIRRFAARERAELRRIEEYYIRAGEKRGRLRYMQGMLAYGLIVLVALSVATAGVLALFGALDLEDEDVRAFFASAAAGGIGAVVSVMMRMSGRGQFAVDHELGRRALRLVGAYRPLIGSVSGIVVYFLVQTTIVPIEDSALTFPFFVVVAFLAGFSERWTRIMLSGAMRTVVDDGGRAGERRRQDDADAPEAETPSTAPS